MRMAHRIAQPRDIGVEPSRIDHQRRLGQPALRQSRLKRAEIGIMIPAMIAPAKQKPARAQHHYASCQRGARHGFSA